MAAVRDEAPDITVPIVTSIEEHGIVPNDLQMEAKTEANTISTEEGYLPAIGGYKGTFKRHNIEGLPEATITRFDDATTCLLDLKNKLNELQAKREKFWQSQAASAGVFVVTGGTGALVSGGAAFYQHKKTDQIKDAMRDIIAQINQLRQTFGKDPAWAESENSVVINARVFKAFMDRDLLKGDL